jgi:MFS transporter, NNP family, nitrate/nitrite transporter
VVTSRWTPRQGITLAIATVGFGLNVKAWQLLAQHLYERLGVELGTFALLLAVPVVVSALLRLPLGVLTDRYGARVVFPVVSLVAAASSFGLAISTSVPVAVVAGSLAGVAGTAFVVGASLVSRAFPYGRRGVALGVFGLGTALAVVVTVAIRWLDPDGRAGSAVLGGLLVCFAGLAALVLRDDVTSRPEVSSVRRCAEMVRQASRTSLTLLYALALGGVTAVGVYLPVFLVSAYHLEVARVWVVAGVLVVVAAVFRLAGGWWTDRRPTARLLAICYAVAAGLCLLLALEPRPWWLAVPMLTGIAICDGLASGALLALIGKAARLDSVGAVIGVTGAVGALGGLVPPMVLAAVDRLTRTYSTGWTLLAVALVAAALYVRKNGLRIGMGLAVQFEPEPGPTAMTVAVVGESDTDGGPAAVVTCLAELAASDELVVVYGSDESVRPLARARAFAAGLRERLPRYNVVAVPVALHGGVWERDAAALSELVEVGTVPIAVTPTADLHGVAAELSTYLHADRVLRASFTPATGADLRQVWTRN